MITVSHIIGERVRELRKQRGWTQFDLMNEIRAKGATWAQNSVSEMESGKRRSDHLEVLAVLCSVFGMPLDEFLPSSDTTVGESRRMSELKAGIQGNLPDKNLPRIEQADVSLVAMCRNIGVSEDDLTRWAEQEHGAGADPLRVRDQIAGVTPDDSHRTAQAKRGHATRKIKRMIQETT